MEIQAILDQMILVVLHVSLWQGRKALHREDLASNGINVDKLPPGTLATLGSKRIISPEAVKIFASLKREADRLCLQHGVRFVGAGYAVPKEKVEKLNMELQRIKGAFDVAKAEFLSVYDIEVEKWINSNPPEWSSIIRAAIEPPSHIKKTISFNYAAISVNAPADVENNGLDEEMGSLYGQLCHEVRQAARQAYETSFVGKQEVTRKALRPIRAIREKLAGLSFLDQGIVDTIQVIDDTLAKLPKNGSIKGTDLNMVAGLVGRQLANIGRDVPVEAEIEEEIIEDAPEYIISAALINSQNSGDVAPITWDF